MILDNKKHSHISKNDIEIVEQKKNEQYFLGTVFRKAGLKIYAYDSINDNLYELKIKYSNTIYLIPQFGKLTAVDLEAAKCLIDSRHEVFEALNFESAKKRLSKVKKGLLPELFNFRTKNNYGLTLN